MNKEMKAYVAGKITGNPDFEREFKEAEEDLRSRGYNVMNPSTLGAGFEQDDYLHVCKAMIDVCGVIFFLPTWKDSPGANVEMEYSEFHSKDIRYYNRR